MLEGKEFRHIIFPLHLSFWQELDVALLLQIIKRVKLPIFILLLITEKVVFVMNKTQK